SLHTFFFFFYDTASTEIYTLSLHDALPIFLRSSNPMPYWSIGMWTLWIWMMAQRQTSGARFPRTTFWPRERSNTFLNTQGSMWRDRKSTRLNSSHVKISYAVFCLKKKKNNT